MTETEDFETNHLDRVTCLHINYNGTKILTGSIDHRIKVWSVSPQTQQRSLVETFTAHDADIRDAKWLHPATGSHLGTVGNDLKFHLWGEELAQAPNSGRRFRRLYTINSPTRVPFVSLDFRNVDNVYTYLAVIDRQGLLSIYEPTNPDEFRDWTLVDRWNVVVPVPSRGEQTSFRVRWDHNVMPLPYVCGVCDERKQLSLVVTAGNEVKIYRGVASASQSHDNDSGSIDGGASHRIIFYEAFKLPPHPSLVRDVQWAPFNVRGTDLFATACKDGAVRIFEVAVSDHPDSNRRTLSARQNTVTSDTSKDASNPNTPQNKPRSTTTIRQQPPQSSTLTSAITGGRQAQQSQPPSQSTPQSQQQQQQDPRSSNLNQSTTSTVGTNINTTTSPSTATGMSPAAITRHTAPRNTFTFPYKHTINLAANLERAHDDAWTVSWDPNGQVLVSGGADGSTKIWRRSVLDMDAARNGAEGGTGEVGAVQNGVGGAAVGLGSAGGGGRWMLFADQAVAFGEDAADASDVDDDDDG